MSRTPMLRAVGGVVLVVGISAFAFVSRDRWISWFIAEATTPEAETQQSPVADAKVLKLSPQARKNLGLVAKPVAFQTYWRSIQVPGVIVDRPGVSDRRVTSPVVGVVTQVHAFAGNTVRPGETLFTVRLFSEYLQNTQSELFKATGEILLIKEQLARIEGLARSGTIAGNRILELNQQIRRQDTLMQAYRQDLLTRGLAPTQIEQITRGKFVSTIDVVAPPPVMDVRHGSQIEPVASQLVDSSDGHPLYEVQELNVELGQQVQAGQLLSTLSNHSLLYVEGRAFKREAPFVEAAVKNSWNITIEFAEDAPGHWPPLEQTFVIRHISNNIDMASRTFHFIIPLTNQFRAYEKGDHTSVVWRFRPGQRVRLHIPVEQLKNVLVVPTTAIAREGPETFVFRQNGDLFNRISVHVLHEDRLNVVLENDGGLAPGVYLAQGSGASLNRVLKAQAASGVRADVHVHADGTVHAAH